MTDADKLKAEVRRGVEWLVLKIGIGNLSAVLWFAAGFVVGMTLAMVLGLEL